MAFFGLFERRYWSDYVTVESIGHWRSDHFMETIQEIHWQKWHLGAEGGNPSSLVLSIKDTFYGRLVSTVSPPLPSWLAVTSLTTCLLAIPSAVARTLNPEGINVAHSRRKI